MSIKGNIIIGQSGGPTAVINSSLAGAITAAKDAGVKKIYGMHYGIEGFLNENILNYLTQNYPNCCVHEIAKGRYKVEIELNTGLELVFNKNGEFLRYDD